MIDKELAKTKFKEIDKEHLLKVIEATLLEFPKKLDLVLKNSKDHFFEETRYYARHIRESYAFVFHDTELNKFCHKIEEAVDTNDRGIIMNCINDLQKYGPAFIADLNAFYKDLTTEI